MTKQKRLFDLLLSLFLLPFLAVVVLVVALIVLLLDGWPVFFGSERMKGPNESFTLWKFRTMHCTKRAEQGVSGGDKISRITPLGQLLRRYRIDEFPQILNILLGDMSFVGPRPPLRQYVEAENAIYSETLQSRPGVTGLATIIMHDFENDLLSRCKTAEETDSVYRRRCIPLKARIDRIYLLNQSLWLDIKIIWMTLGCVLRA